MPLDTPGNERPSERAHERPHERPEKRLDQKVALVTSSAPGICAQTAMQLAREGAKVIVCGRNANQGLATVKQIRSEGGRATFVLADIAIIADVQSVIDETIATYGRLDILFNNVSNSYAQDALVADVSESVWDRLIEPLLKGTFFCCQHALPFLQQSSSGTIINLIEKTPSSRDDSVSAVCHGGVLALTGAIAQQFAASSVTANVIWAAPFAEAIGVPNAAEVSERLTALPDSHLLLSQVLTKPIAQDGERALVEPPPFANIAEAVMYLACYGSRFHGAALLVDI
jgi:NAD(P)-dependent dehydrogenase (short-subunit alcohol dehydrogenase family)